MYGFIKQLKDFIRTDVGIYPFIFGLIISCKPLGFNVGPIDLISIALYLITAVIILFKKPVFDNLSVIFLLYLPFTIFIDSPKDIFRSWERFALFACLFICVSPAIKSDYACHFRKGTFITILLTCVTISVVSFACYFLGINYMRSMFTNDSLEYLINTAGTFGGITSQSMLLGPISGIGVVAGCYLATRRKNKIFWILPVICFGSLLFSASRSSLIATIIGVASFFLYYSGHRGKGMKSIVTILLIGALSFPLWETYLNRINAKNMGDIQSGINLDSRQKKWDIRIQEWEDSPLTGIGFVSVSERDNYSSNGVIEPGSSWLGVLSMTGIIGFALFLAMYIRAIRKSLFTRTPYGALTGGILILVGIHMIAEGHVFSAGSFLCFLTWLSIGSATDCSRIIMPNYTES